MSGDMKPLQTFFGVISTVTYACCELFYFALPHLLLSDAEYLRTFTPDQIEVWEDTREGANGPWAPRWQNPRPPADGKWVAQATFSEPGTYVLRLRADDGALTTDDDVTVKVTP